MNTFKQARGESAPWKRAMSRTLVGAAAMAMAATGVAASTAVSAPAHAATAGTAAATTAAAPPRGTIRITNANQSLTAGVIGANGRGTVFTSVSGNQQRVQQWNVINGTLLNRGRSARTSRCLEAGSGGSVFLAPCVTGRNSQKWAFKEDGKQFRIQNFQTKKCLRIGAETPQQTAPVTAVECKDERRQTWFATQVEPSDF